MGLVGVIFAIAARSRTDRQPSTTWQESIRCGRHAVIAGGVTLAILMTISVVLELSDWRLLLIVEPALMLGVTALVLAEPKARPGISVVGLMGFVAWVGVAIAIPIEVSALQLDREARETIINARERLAIADRLMDDGYEEAVHAKFSSARDLRIRRWARLSLREARTGLQATERLAARSREGPERRRLLGLRADFIRQIGRYEEFVRGLGETP